MIDKRVAGVSDVLLVLCLDSEEVVIHLRFVGKHRKAVRHALKQLQGRVGTSVHHAFGLLQGVGKVGALASVEACQEDEYDEGY